eukprot:1342757-Pleurochrysis_carterae.AAC.9
MNPNLSGLLVYPRISHKSDFSSVVGLTRRMVYENVKIETQINAVSQHMLGQKSKNQYYLTRDLPYFIHPKHFLIHFKCLARTPISQAQAQKIPSALLGHSASKCRALIASLS